MLCWLVEVAPAVVEVDASGATVEAVVSVDPVAVVSVVSVEPVSVVVAGGIRCRRSATSGQHLQHRAELQLGGLADELEGPVLVLHARDLHQDRVALAGDLGLGHAEGVDALVA